MCGVLLSNESRALEEAGKGDVDNLNCDPGKKSISAGFVFVPSHSTRSISDLKIHNAFSKCRASLFRAKSFPLSLTTVSSSNNPNLVPSTNPIEIVSCSSCHQDPGSCFLCRSNSHRRD